MHPDLQIEVYGTISSRVRQCFTGEKFMKSITQVRVLIGAAAAVLAIPTVAQKKTKDEVSEVITSAKYVYVEAYDGPEWNPRLTGKTAGLSPTWSGRFAAGAGTNWCCGEARRK